MLKPRLVVSNSTLNICERDTNNRESVLPVSLIGGLVDCEADVLVVVMFVEPDISVVDDGTVDGSTVNELIVPTDEAVVVDVDDDPYFGVKFVGSLGEVDEMVDEAECAVEVDGVCDVDGDDVGDVDRGGDEDVEGKGEDLLNNVVLMVDDIPVELNEVVDLVVNDFVVHLVDFV